MTKNHPRIVLKERSLKCMLCSKCNGRLLLTFFGQKGRDLADRGGLPGTERIPAYFGEKIFSFGEKNMPDIRVRQAFDFKN